MDTEEVFRVLESDSYFEKEARRVTSIEIDQARIMERHYKAARKRVMERLSRLNFRDEFNRANLIYVMQAIDEELASLAEITGREAEFSSEILMDEGRDDLIQELGRLEEKFTGVARLYPYEAVEVAYQSDNYLIERYKSSLKNYNVSTRTRVQQQVANAVIERKYNYEVVQAVGGVLDSEEWKVRRIVRTELANIYSLSKLNSMMRVRDETAPDMMKTIYNPMDARTGEDSKYLEKMKMIIPLEDDFEFTYKGVEYSFSAPPNRPNDRGVLVPILKHWTE